MPKWSYPELIASLPSRSIRISPVLMNSVPTSQILLALQTHTDNKNLKNAVFTLEGALVSRHNSTAGFRFRIITSPEKSLTIILGESEVREGA